MTGVEFAGLAALVTATSAAVDYTNARYVRAVAAGRRRAAMGWTVTQWAATSVGFAVAVGLSLWILPFEGLGLAIGTWYGTREPRATLGGS